MPQIANITVKKKDGTTDTTYSAVVPSAGDKSPALWRNTSVGSAVAHQPTFSMVSRNNGTNTARRVECTYSYPETVTGTDGRVTVADRLILTVSAVVPMGMSGTVVDEAVSQGLNLLASSLCREAFKSGYAPS